MSKQERIASPSREQILAVRIMRSGDLTPEERAERRRVEAEVERAFVPIKEGIRKADLRAGGLQGATIGL